MKNFKTLFILCFIALVLVPIEDVQAQRKNAEYAFERVVFERWNRFRPRWWFKWIYRKYDDEDRRNILYLAPIMVSTTITADYTERQKLNTDTIFRNEVNLALDRVMQKQWILFDEERVLERYNRIDQLMEELMENGLDVEQILRLEAKIFMEHEKIDIVQNSYIGDAEKSLGINEYIDELDIFIDALYYMKQLTEIPDREVIIIE